MDGLFTVTEFATIFEKLLSDSAESRTILEGVERSRAQIARQWIGFCRPGDG